MNITVFSIVPLFPNFDMGGAQKHLRYIANHLGERGHTVTILCTKRHDTKESFNWHPKVTIHPILQFKQPFPSPYDTGAFNLGNIIQDIVENLEGADRFYIHDGEMLFPYIYENIPTVVGLRDNVYPETMMGAYLFRGASLITISDYSKRFIEATVGRFFPELPSRLKRINNGLDWAYFKPTEGDKIWDIVPKNLRENYKIILQPHRPENTKGMWQAIAMAEKLVKQRQDFRVLYPKWIGTDADKGVLDFYAEVDRVLAEKGLSDYFVSHRWIPYELLPQYYSLGDVTLSLGSFVESFGNAVYESLGCGTPSVVARIATHRELLPDNLVDKVDFDDAETASSIVDEILGKKRRTSNETLDYLKAHYSVTEQLAAYAETIEKAEVAKPMSFSPMLMTAETKFQLAPWCYITKGRIYHDFHASYRDEAVLIGLLEGGLSVQKAEAAGVNAETFEAWYRDGYIVPVKNS
jgi:glycosyltransferase involved in cell wall biosynthesis